MTQNDVAARMGLTQQKLSHLELNAPNVSADRLLRLLSVLGVELVLRRPAAASQTTDESPRDSRRLFGLSQAAIAVD